jgi:hypothetical protein
MRHPRVTLILTSIAFAGLIVFCAFQISDGTDLGASWLIAAVAGIVVGAALGVAVYVTNLHRPRLNGIGIAWAVLLALSVLSLEFTFSMGRHGSGHAFVNVVLAASLGYLAVTCAALIAVFAFLLIHRGALPSRAALRQQFPRRPRPARPAPGWPTWVFGAAAAALIAGIALAVAAGSAGHGGESKAAGFLILLALAALCVAVTAAVYRRIRSRRLRRRDLSR